MLTVWPELDLFSDETTEIGVGYKGVENSTVCLRLPDLGLGHGPHIDISTNTIYVYPLSSSESIASCATLRSQSARRVLLVLPRFQMRKSSQFRTCFAFTICV